MYKYPLTDGMIFFQGRTLAVVEGRKRQADEAR